MPLKERFTEEDRGHDTPCWIWKRSFSSSGYGTLSWAGTIRLAHRVFFELEYGWLPSMLDHACRQRICVNPHHLRPATRVQNGQNRDQRGWGNSRYRGVCWHRTRQRWAAYGSLNGKKITIGRFRTEEEAASAVATWRAENMPYSDADRPPSRAS